MRRTKENLTFEEYDKIVEAENDALQRAKNGKDSNVEDDLGVGDEEETEDLLSLDPKEWKVPFLFRSIVSSSLAHVLMQTWNAETRPLYGPRSLAPAIPSDARPDQNCAYVLSPRPLLTPS